MILDEILFQAAKNGWATGHFNISELDQFRAIVEACKEIGAPAIVGTSEGERTHIGLTEAVAVRDAFRKDFGIPIFLNADHSKSVASAKAAVDAGYDSIHIDLSVLSFEENIKGVKEIADYIRGISPKISLEGELGYLKGESKMEKEKIEVNPDDYTNPDEARTFVERTGVSRLAVVVGNIHGISLDEPALDISRIKEIRMRVPEHVALVLHAGSGIPEDQIRAAIDGGVVNIHINTELRVAFADALRQSLSHDLEEAAMYKLDAAAGKAFKELVKEKLRLFGSEGRL